MNLSVMVERKKGFRNSHLDPVPATKARKTKGKYFSPSRLRLNFIPRFICAANSSTRLSFFSALRYEREL